MAIVAIVATERSRTIPPGVAVTRPSEPETERIAAQYFEDLGYFVRFRRTGNATIDTSWPSKSGDGAGTPDLLLFPASDDSIPLAVCEAKVPTVNVDTALEEAKFYIQGLHQRMPAQPNLPRVAIGYNGSSLRSSYLDPTNAWVPVKDEDGQLIDRFLTASTLKNGISSTGQIVPPADDLTSVELHRVLEKLKRVYRGIPALKSGRRPIDFTVALLTLKILVEREQSWGTWAEQTTFVTDAESPDEALRERFMALVKRCMDRPHLRESYGGIFEFKETSQDDSEVSFDFAKTLAAIPHSGDFYVKMFDLLDTLPHLHGANFDIFGEVYQAIGDDSTKKAFGEYFTGRHIISGLVPVFLSRANVNSFEDDLRDKKIADIACGTGGFLTETLRHIRSTFALDEEGVRDFAKESFFGYDISGSNAARARVNMYFAGDGFSEIRGGVDSLSRAAPLKRSGMFDFILTNPPYGSSSQYSRLEEAFIDRTVELIKRGSGRAMIVLPTGVLENPRSAPARFRLLKAAEVTDVVALPKHAFAPYTQQRTAVVFLRRRAQDVRAESWPELVGKIGLEKISMFIVDNDGFANSDKRYPTTRCNEDGSWVHDDLRPWVSEAGEPQPSNLVKALINDDDSFFVHGDRDDVPSKYARKSVKAMATSDDSLPVASVADIKLLPDVHLRRAPVLFSKADFLKTVASLKDELAQASSSLSKGELRTRLRRLLTGRINFAQDVTASEKIQSVDELFTVKKGTPALTEAVMYSNYDPQGLEVFGGGEARSKDRIRADTLSGSGKPVSIFEGPALVVSLDGSSGTVHVVEEGKFASNHHAAVLIAKKKPSVEWLYHVAQQMEGPLRSLASNQGSSSTLTQPVLKEFKVHLAEDKDTVVELGEARRYLAGLRVLLA